MTSKNNQEISKILALIGMIITLISILAPYFLDKPLWDRVPVTFDDGTGDTLSGSYYPGQIKAGVMMLEGFGSDQVALRSAASEFAKDGYHVFTFDFSGHGRSGGTLGFDNAQTPRLANQTLVAIEQFKNRSGLSGGEIILLGHSLGARVALQAATMDPDLAGLILLGTQVNLITNTQAELFTGVSDADLDWVQSLDVDQPATNILMISGEWDDILTPNAAHLLAKKLGGQSLSAKGAVGDTLTSTGREFVLLPNLLHNYEIFSPRVLEESQAWAADALELDLPRTGAAAAAIRIVCWLLGFAGMLLAIYAAAGWLKTTANEEDSGVEIKILITDLKRFLVGKLVIWLGALPLGAILAGVFFFLPIGLPVFNLTYVAFFGGYGLLVTLLYRLGRLPGTQGRLPFTAQQKDKPRGAVFAIGLTVLMLFVCALYARTGQFFVYPLNVRLLWLVLFSLPTALGFWIGVHEIGMIARIAPGKTLPQVWAMLIGIFPFFLYAAFQAGIGSVSGVVGSLQGLLTLALVLSFGYLLRQVTRNPWLVAFGQALLLYWLVLPVGVLFG